MEERTECRTNIRRQKQSIDFSRVYFSQRASKGGKKKEKEITRERNKNPGSVRHAISAYYTEYDPAAGKVDEEVAGGGGRTAQTVIFIIRRFGRYVFTCDDERCLHQTRTIGKGKREKK